MTPLWSIHHWTSVDNRVKKLFPESVFGAVQRVKMWTSLSASRWICLLALVVVMLVSALQVDSYDPNFLALPCCHNVSSRRTGKIKTCYEQKPREDCDQHALLVTTKRNRTWCINPAAEWINNMIEKGKLKCPPVLELISRVQRVDAA